MMHPLRSLFTGFDIYHSWLLALSSVLIKKLSETIMPNYQLSISTDEPSFVDNNIFEGNSTITGAACIANAVKNTCQ